MPAQRGACSVHVTPREVEILDLLAQGFDNADIGVTIGIGTGTVKHYINGLAAKLHLDNSEKINRLILLASLRAHQISSFPSTTSGILPSAEI
jgi:DNA-binding NarL/FixJ family response regulator